MLHRVPADTVVEWLLDAEGELVEASWLGQGKSQHVVGSSESGCWKVEEVSGAAFEGSAIAHGIL